MASFLGVVEICSARLEETSLRAKCVGRFFLFLSFFVFFFCFIETDRVCRLISILAERCFKNS